MKQQILSLFPQIDLSLCAMMLFFGVFVSRVIKTLRGWETRDLEAGAWLPIDDLPTDQPMDLSNDLSKKGADGEIPVGILSVLKKWWF